MTLNDIIVSALAQLDRGHDAQSLDVWRDKFTRFANDGVTDICATYKPRRTETIDTKDGTFTTAMLSRGCRKVLSVKRDGREEDFYDGDASEVIVTSGGPGKIEVTYRSVPREMFASTDEPDIPAYMHGLLVSYVVGRERAAGTFPSSGAATFTSRCTRRARPPYGPIWGRNQPAHSEQVVKPMARKIYRIDEFMGLDQSMGKTAWRPPTALTPATWTRRTASLP